MKKAVLLLYTLSILKSFGQINLNSGLSACYALNGNGYDPIHQLHGTLSTVANAPNRFGSSNSAMLFNGMATSYLELPDDPLLKPAALSFAAWVKPGFGFTSSGSLVFTKNQNGVDPAAYALVVENTTQGKRFVVRKSTGVVTTTLSSTTNPLLNTWYHVCFTMDNSALHLYVNGVLESTSTTTLTFNYAPGKKIYLGGTNETAQPMPFSGLLDNVRFYNRILSAAEVNQLYVSDPSCLSTSLAPVAAFTVSSGLCVGQPVAFKDASSNHPEHWNWQIPGAITANALDADPVFTFSTAGIYTVGLTVSNALGMSNISSTVLINAVPTLTAVANPTLLCRNMTCTLTAAGAVNYTWTPVVPAQNTGTAYASPLMTTTYTLLGEDATGCRNTTTVQVKVISDCWTSLQVNAFKEAEVLVYPNPTKGKITVKGSLPTHGELTVVDAFGKQILTNTWNTSDEATLDLTELSEGMYFLKMQSGNQVRVMKLLKQ